MSRQGDTLYIKIKAVPKTAKKSESKTIALGEVNGHHHTFQGQLQIFREPKLSMCRTGRYAEIDNAKIVHQEHAELKFEKQIVEIRTQRELSLISEVQKIMD